MIKRYWVSWFDYANTEQICTDFQYWITGYTWDSAKLYAVIDAESEPKVWERIGLFFKNIKQRSIEEKHIEWKPGKEFIEFENRT